jgi:FkbM family methyltransferase
MGDDVPRRSDRRPALGAVAGHQIMQTYRMSTINSLVPNARYAVRFDEQSSSITVNCTTIDLFCGERKIDKIDVLKIDTERFEQEVLRGAAMLNEGLSRSFFRVR